MLQPNDRLQLPLSIAQRRLFGHIKVIVRCSHLEPSMRDLIRDSCPLDGFQRMSNHQHQIDGFHQIPPSLKLIFMI